MAKKRKKSIPKKTVKRTPKKTVKRTPKKTVKRTPKKTVKHTPKKTVKRTPKKTVKRTLKKTVKRTLKKTVKRTLKKTVKRTLKKTVKRAPKKTVKRTLKKTVKRTPKRTSKSTNKGKLTKAIKELGAERLPLRRTPVFGYLYQDYSIPYDIDYLEDDDVVVYVDRDSIETIIEREQLNNPKPKVMLAGFRVQLRDGEIKFMGTRMMLLSMVDELMEAIEDVLGRYDIVTVLDAFISIGY